MKLRATLAICVLIPHFSACSQEPDFAPPADLTGGAADWIVELVDWDNDSDLDLTYYGGGVSNHVIWRENLGSRKFGQPRNIYHPERQFYPLGWADFNADNLPDIYSIRDTPGPDGSKDLILFFNQGDGILGDPTPVFSTTSPGLRFEFAGDFDSDGFNDFLVHIDNAFTILWNEQGRSFTLETNSFPETSFAGLMVLANEDTAPDYLTINRVSGRSYFRVYLNQGGRTFATVAIDHPHAIPNADPENAFCMDLNGDNLPEIIIRPGNTSTWYWSENLGAGDFGPWNEHTFELPEFQYHGFSPGTSLELPAWVLSTVTSDSSTPYPITNTRFFRLEIDPSQQVGTPIEIREHGAPVEGSDLYVVHLVAGDLDGDQHVDWASTNALTAELPYFIGAFTVGMFQMNQVAWLDGDGNLKFSSISGTPVLPQNVTAGDFDGDGAIDVIAGPNPEGIPVFYRGNSTGSFHVGVPLSDLFPTFRQSDLFVANLESGDLDADGDLDLLIAFQTRPYLNGTEQVSVLYVAALNDGHGSFIFPISQGNWWSSHSVGFRSRYQMPNNSLHLVDWDSSGTPDLIVKSVDASSWTWSGIDENSIVMAPRFLVSTGSLTDAFGNFVSGDQVRLADIDGDLDLDFMTTPSVFGDPFGVYLNDGNLGLNQAVLIEIGPEFSATDAFGNPISSAALYFDYDEDGDPDIISSRPVMDPATVTVAGWKLGIFRNDDGQFTRDPVSEDSCPGMRVFSVADADGNDRVELIGRDYENSSIVSFDPGNGQIQPATIILPEREKRTRGVDDNSTVWIDVDGDRDDDMIYASTHGIFFARNRFTESTDPIMFWATRYGLGGLFAAPDADPDHDGLCNLGELGFGTDPSSPGDPKHRLPRVSPQTQAVRYHRRRNIQGELVQLQFRVEWSIDGQSWMNADNDYETVLGQTSEYEVVEALPPPDLRSEPSLLVRVRVNRS